MRILYDVLVKLDSFTFLVNYLILDFKVKVKVPIIMGRLFFVTERVLVDLELNKLKFRLNEEEVSFDVCRSMKQQKEVSVVSIINVTYEDDQEVLIEEIFVVETLVAVLMNFNSERIK